MPTDPPAEGAGYLRRSVTRVRDESVQLAEDLLAEEIPVAMHYDGVAFAVMMATPHDLEDFAYGFSLTEGRAQPGDIVAVEIRPVLEGIFLDVKTRNPAPIDTDARAGARNLPGRSGCGICGSRLLEEVVKHPAPVAEGTPISAASLEAALQALGHRQPLNAATGATHAAAWARADGELALVREDVGRHNALDKLIGAMLRAGVEADCGFALVTSRASYEMVTKAAIAGIPVLAAISAPTALAVHLAQDCGLTLAGFVRPGRHVIYSHPRRLIQQEDPAAG